MHITPFHLLQQITNASHSIFKCCRHDEDIMNGENQNVLPGQSWTSCGNSSLVSPPVFPEFIIEPKQSIFSMKNVYGDSKKAQ